MSSASLHSPPAAQPHRALLRLLDLDAGPTILPLDRPVLHIGRARETNNLVLTGPGIAAHHCSLRREGERWVLRDRGSPTGTHVNSRRCHEPTELRDGDRISLGLHLLEFCTAPSLALPQVLARLRDAPIDLQFSLATPHTTPAAPRTRGPGLLRPAALAAAASLTLTLGIAANLAAAPPDPQSSYMSPGTSTSEPTGHDGMFAANAAATLLPASPNERSSVAARPLTNLRSNVRDLSVGAGTPTNPLPTSAAERTEYLAEPPTFELPADALGRGRPDAGALVHALALPPSPDYTIRCPAHAHASSATVNELMLALASFRNRSDYRGELVVGDLSQHGGGRYGPHRSHQSGRDVDLWLPVRGGRYRRGCVRCGTDLCRPSPREVDWPATWQLVQALTSRGAAQDIFLDWSLQPALRAAAMQEGAPASQLGRQIQHPIRGRAALVKHAAGHIHHLHVRFRCPPDDPGCVATP